MKKLIYLSIFIVTVMLIFIGCTTKSLPTTVEGQWDLESVSNINGGTIFIGKANDDYENSNRLKRDMVATFKEDGSFEITETKDDLQGEYHIDEKLSTRDAIAIIINFHNGNETKAVHGIREYIEDDKEVNSLQFTIDKKTYSFIKSTDI